MLTVPPLREWQRVALPSRQASSPLQYRCDFHFQAFRIDSKKIRRDFPFHCNSATPCWTVLTRMSDTSKTFSRASDTDSISTSVPQKHSALVKSRHLAN